MKLYKHQVPQWKVDEVKSLADEIRKSEVVGLINVEGVGAKQLQGIRESLRKTAKIRMARNSLMRLAVRESGLPGIEELEQYIKGPVAFIFGKTDPFTLTKFLAENKASAPAKGGQIATKDIIIPAMNTGVAPGPFISELAALKIPARVKGGVIHVTEDTLVVKAGEVISNTMAQMLGRLGIQPIDIQLKLIAAYTEGTLIAEDGLMVDLDEIIEQICTGYQQAINLSMNIGYITKEMLPMLIVNAHLEARNLALNIEFFEVELIHEFLAKAESEAAALAALMASRNPDSVSIDLRTQITSSTTTGQPSKGNAPSKEGDSESEEDKGEIVSGLGSLFG
ncbi:MAG: 50S ribosomal protein L10 [Candidatus Thorarchaeota archaeon]